MIQKGERIMRSAFVSFLVVVSAAAVCGAEPKTKVRPITEAESVLAVYHDDWGLGSRGGPGIIFAAWPDGHVVWSDDHLKGGPPYRTGDVDPKKVTALLARFAKDGLFADKKLNQSNFGPDSSFITVFVKSGKKQVKMASWHELFEATEKTVVTHNGVSGLEGQRRLDVLRKEPADYLFYRFVWSETRGRLNELIPVYSIASDGEPVMKAGILSWQEPSDRVR